MQEKVDWMKKIKDDMQRHVEKYSIYEQFLHQVITQSTELKTINDILNRLVMRCCQCVLHCPMSIDTLP